MLDELGAGTDPDEGGAIGQAVLDELRRIGCLGMLTTHLSVLKAYAFTHNRVDNASVEFDPKTMTPTYRLRIGTPGESHAITVAQHLGMPKRITSDAKRHLSSQGEQFKRAIQATSVARETAEQARAQAQVAHLAAVTQQDAYQAKLADLHRLREEFDTWLASLPHMSPGDKIPIRKLGKTGTLVRMELHRQIAVVDADNVQIEVPLSDLLPELGADNVRKEISSLRDQILTQAKDAEQLRAEAEHVRSEYHRSLQYQKQRARQFDAWLGAIARVKVGDVVPMSKKPGKAKVISVDLVGLRAKLEAEGKQFDLAIQELFPQTGPFAAPHKASEPGKHEPNSKPKMPAEKPMTRRQGGSPKKSRQTLLDIEPGAEVFVVPFNKRATLIRIEKAREHAVVQSGIFEIEIPLKDLEPVDGNVTKNVTKRSRKKPHSQKKPSQS